MHETRIEDLLNPSRGWGFFYDIRTYMYLFLLTIIAIYHQYLDSRPAFVACRPQELRVVC